MIVAEVGLNHQGRLGYVFKYLENLILTNVDAVTYQIREKDFYSEEQYSELELSFDQYKIINNHLHRHGKKFGIALADHDLVDRCEEIDVDFYKTLSWDINSFDFLDRLVETKKPIFISTGVSSVDTIDRVFNRYPNSNITFIHTQLQFEVENVNLLAIDFLKNRYSFPVAFGNHCENTNVLYTAVAFKPSDIFMYVKTDLDIEHIDEKHSIRLSDVGDLVNNLKELPKSLGKANKFDVEIEDKYLILNTKEKK